MKNWIKEVVAHNADEKYRVPVFAVASVALLSTSDGTLGILAFLTGMMAFMALSCHLMRRFLFPTFNLSEFLTECKNGNVAAAITVAAILGFTAVLLFCLTGLLGAIRS